MNSVVVTERYLELVDQLIRENEKGSVVPFKLLEELNSYERTRVGSVLVLGKEAEVAKPSKPKLNPKLLEVLPEGWIANDEMHSSELPCWSWYKFEPRWSESCWLCTGGTIQPLGVLESLTPNNVLGPDSLYRIEKSK